MDTPKLAPVILSGGVGAGLWPPSRESCPRQLIALNGRLGDDYARSCLDDDYSRNRERVPS